VQHNFALPQEEAMKIGIIGTHIVGIRLAAEFARAGHNILLANSRGPEAVKARLEESGVADVVTPASVVDVLECPLVVLAAPWIKREEVLDSTRDWQGRILLDATNIYLSYPPNYRIDDLNGDSGSEIIARLAPTARVVKAFNTLDFGTMFSPVPAGMKRVLFAAGDDDNALTTVCGLIEDIGFRAVPLGSLAVGGRLMDLEQPLSLLNLLTPSGTA
jgi:predicted dinucleotide-binding enzyme